MDFFKGLNSAQIGALRHCGGYRDLQAGEVLFHQGDPAYGLFAIIRGKMEILKITRDGTVKLAELGANETFGEIGMLSSNAQRTATARAVEQTVLFEVRHNPLEMFQQVGDHTALIRMAQNLICLLGRRLRGKDDPGAPQIAPESALIMPVPGYEFKTDGALKTVKDVLPGGLLQKWFSQPKFKAGEFLCKEGDVADGFYYLNSGSVRVIKKRGEGSEIIGMMHAPTVVGELGFFSGEPRAATIEAVEDVGATHFSGKDFKRLEKEDPQKAVDLLFAAAQLIIHLLFEREGSAEL